MGTKRGFLLTAAVFACFSTVCSQAPVEVRFDAVVKDKVYNGDNIGQVSAVYFFKTADDGLVSGLRPFDPNDATKQYDYKVESVIFSTVDANVENTKAAVKIKFNTTPIADLYEFAGGAREMTVEFPKIINQDKAYIAISCKDIFIGGTPNPVVDTMNLFYDKTGAAPWSDPDWRAENITWRFAQMNMEPDTSIHIQKPEGEAIPLPAWRKDLPVTRGTYWAQAIFAGNENYVADTSKFVVFNITNPQSVSIKNKSIKQNSLAFAGLKNGEINLSLKAEFYTIELYNLQGRLIARTDLMAKSGINATGLKITDLSKGMLILSVKQSGVSVLQHKIPVK